jgi:hypothetical protein
MNNHSKYVDKISILVNATSQPFKTRVENTLNSFAYLHAYAAVLNKFVSVDELVARTKEIFQTANEHATPDCPEISDDQGCVKEEMVLFQKINRYLFDKYDAQILAHFQTVTHKHVDDFAFPVFEWAVNVMPEFTYSQVCSNLDQGTNVQDNVIIFIKQNFNTASCQEYFEGAWNRIDQWNGVIEGRGGLIDRLRSDMCYPARLSVLVE